MCEAHLSISPDGVKELQEENGKILERKEASSAQMRKLVGRLNFGADAKVMGRVGRAPPRP